MLYLEKTAILLILYSFGADGKEGGEGNDADIYYQP
jgi:hypothetical protein